MTTTTTTACSRCGSLSTDLLHAVSTPEGSCPQLRSRLADIEELLNALTAERCRIQAELDSIVYPVLTLPTEITMEIFHRTLPPMPHPSPGKSPLLLGQICRRWREIAWNAHNLWQFLALTKSSPVELLRLWLSRSGNAGLHYSLTCSEPTAADALMGALLDHSHHWEDMMLGLFHSSFSRLKFGPLSMLRKIAFEIQPANSPDVMPERIAIRNAPLLQSVRLATPKIAFDLPYPQLTSLTLNWNMEFVKCVALISLCPQLIYLDIAITGPESSTSPATPTIALHFLESLSVLVLTPSVLPHLTLPRLRKFTLKDPEHTKHVDVLRSLIQRSSCRLEALCISGDYLFPQVTSQWLVGLPDSIASLEVTWQKSVTTSIFGFLSSTDILPGLTAMNFRDGRLSADAYAELQAMLRARRQVSSQTALLTYLDVRMSMAKSLRTSWDSAANIASFQAFTDGLKIHIELRGTLKLKTNTIAIMDSQGNGLTWG
ncbi:hypothetical protein C8J57DRAFT_308166 [Mycena rebaudengoi]|nr:hypothetical protein C8J57DRAFT_308166 [Mycena rebaudengoi]